MSDGRMLKKAITTSKKLSKLKDDSSRLLYTWLIPFLDVDGRYYGEPDIIKGNIVPRIKTFNTEVIEECLMDMADNGLIYWYAVDEDRYLEFAVFHKHQKINRDREAKSQIPAYRISDGDYNNPILVNPIVQANTQAKVQAKPNQDTEYEYDNKLKDLSSNKNAVKKEKINFDLASHFENLSLDEYIELLQEKREMLDWKLTFFIPLKPYPNTKHLENAVQEYLIWLYSKNPPDGDPGDTILGKLRKMEETGSVPKLKTRQELMDKIEGNTDKPKEKYEESEEYFKGGFYSDGR